MKEITLEILCDLDDAELAQRSQALSLVTLNIITVENNKKTAMKEFKEELEALHKQQWQLSLTVRNRSEVRPEACRVEFHRPMRDQKRISIKSTGEHYRDEPMTAQECATYSFADSIAVESLAERIEEAGATGVVLSILDNGNVQAEVPQYRPEPEMVDEGGK